MRRKRVRGPLRSGSRRFTVHEPDPKWKKGKRFLLVYLGEMCKQDGVDHLVRAIRILREDLRRTTSMRSSWAAARSSR